MAQYKINQVTVLNKDYDEIENFYPNEIITGKIEDYKSDIIEKRFPDILTRFPNIKKHDIVVHITHTKLS